MGQMQDKFEEFIADSKRRVLYEKEALALEATELICSLMRRKNITKAELAKRLGRSKSYVTQLLNGNRNITLHTLAEVFFHLGERADLGTKGRASVERDTHNTETPHAFHFQYGTHLGVWFEEVRFVKARMTHLSQSHAGHVSAWNPNTTYAPAA